MLRKDLKLATVKLLETITNSGTFALLEGLRKAQDPEINQAEVLETYTKYIKMRHDFTDAEYQLIDKLGLDFLNNTKFWTTLLRRDKKSRAYHFTGYQLLKNTLDHLPKLIKLLERPSDQFSTGEEKDENGSSVSTLSLIVIEENQLSTPDRLVLALQSVNGLYHACSNIMGLPGNDLSVVACDSGSDKAFEFLGVAEVVDRVKQVILSYWDKIVSYRDDKTGSYLELVAKSLPIMEEVELMRGGGKLEPEQSEIIKRQLIDSVVKFATAGVTIPEIEGFTTYNPRQLLQPERKLLVEPKQQESVV